MCTLQVHGYLNLKHKTGCMVFSSNAPGEGMVSNFFKKIVLKIVSENKNIFFELLFFEQRYISFTIEDSCMKF